jgi:hypothetical protein
MLPAFRAEAHCPGNVASIRSRIVNHSLMIVPVMLDGAGPYDFVVDTGAQITTIDPSLASDLHPRLLGATHVTGLGTYVHAEYAQLDLLQAGGFSLRTPLILIQDLWGVRQYDTRIRGVLGENFLAHFDLFIDYARSILCLDDTRQMQKSVKGERIALTPVPHAEAYLPFTQPMIIAARVPDVANKPLLLELDSGANVPVLFSIATRMPTTLFAVSPQHHQDADKVTHLFAVLRPMEIRIGSRTYPQIPFMRPETAGKAIGQRPDVDGVLPTVLFRSVFISYADHFAVLQP